MPSLATMAPEDGVLGAIAPLALAAIQPTALVVDLDPNGPLYPSRRTLRDLVVEGPRAVDLVPQRRGLAVLANGGIDPEASVDMVSHLLAGWPAVVLRLGANSVAEVAAPVVPIRLLIPGGLFPTAGRGVWQPVGHSLRAAPDVVGVRLPGLPRRTARGYLDGQLPGPCRWSRAWADVWNVPW